MGRTIAEGHAEWLERRGIDLERAVDMGLYSARHVQGGGDEWQEPEPHERGNILVFPYVDRGREVNAKFRTMEKRFYQRPGAPKTFWNADAIDLPELQDGRQALVITEGELDAIIAIQDGHPWSVSCPDGAPADVDQHGNVIPMKPDAELDPTTDKKFAFIFNNWDRLAKIKRFILATDGDGPGVRLRDELARRLGRVRCAFIEYPRELVVPIENQFGKRACKDLNEVHQYLGAKRVLEVLQRAKPYPVSGLYTLDDYEDRRDLETLSVGFRELDDFIRLYRGGFAVVSGLPFHGKSVLANQIGFNMARDHGWNVAIASFEAAVRPEVRNQLTGFYTRKRRIDWTVRDRQDADAFIRDHFCFITDDPRKGGEDEDATVSWLVDRAADAVVRFGIDMLIVDPWNELTHRRLAGEGRDEYVGRALRMLKRFANLYDVMVMIVAHPTKEAGNAFKAGQPISLYDISDGAMWYNKCELGVIVTKGSGPNSVGRSSTTVSVKKAKFPESGKQGEVVISFDVPTRRFIPQVEIDEELNRERWTAIPA